MVNALFGAAQTGFGRLWRAKRWLAPSRPWLHEHFGRAAVKGGVFALFGAARTGPRRLWRALRRLAPSRPWLHEHFGRAAVTGAVFALFGAARTGPRRLRRALRRLAPSRPLVPPSPGLADCQRRGDRPVWCSTDRARAAGTRWCRCRAQRPVLPRALLPPPDPAPFHARPRPGHGASVRGAVRGVASPTGWVVRRRHIDRRSKRSGARTPRRSLPARPRPSSLACMSAVTVTPACNCWSPSRTAVPASTNG